MRNLILNEITKTWHYTAFRVIVGLHLVLFFLVVMVISRFDITIPGFSTDYLYQFPNVWEYTTWVASWFNLLLAILVIVLTGNEYNFRTFRQQVIDGLGRNELLLGKGFLILMIGIYGLMLVMVFSLLFGFIYTRDYSGGAFFEKSYRILSYFIQAVSYMSLGFLMTVLFRNTALGIVLFLLYRMIIEPVFRMFFPPEARLYFPAKSISSLTPIPEFLSIASGSEAADGQIDTLSLAEMGLKPEDLPEFVNLILAVAYTALFIFLAWLLLRRRNL